MSNPKFKRNGVLFFAIEGTYGTAAAIAAGNAVEAQNIRVFPQEGNDIDRGLERPYMGSTGSFVVNTHQRIEFEVELAGSGAAGTAPAWGPLIRACGVAETIAAGVSVTYNRISTGFESATIEYFLDGTRYRLTGARGTARLVATAQEVPKWRFTMTGLYNGPADAAAATPDYSAWNEPVTVTMANTPTFSLGGWANPVLRNLELDFANQITPRFLVGSEDILISDRQDMIRLQVEAVDLATYDPFAAAVSRATPALQLVHGTTAGNIATLDVPLAQIQRPGSPVDQDNIVEWPLSFAPLPNAGNDEWTLTLT